MKKITRFNQPDVLYEIGSDLLIVLFNRFKEELDARQIVIPSPEHTDGHYYESLAAIFQAQATLPEKMVEIVLAAEEFARPENKALLEAAFWQSPQELYIQPDSCPEHTALKLWLFCPYLCPKPAPSPEPPPLPAAVAPVIPQTESIAPASAEPATAEKSSAVPAAALGTVLVRVKESQKPETKAPSKHSPSFTRRRTGKVACLPKDIREKLNEMISDGRTYAAIITALGEDGRGLTEANVSNWKDGGYKDWLAEQKDYEEAGLWEEYTLDLVKQNSISSLNEATIKMATIQIRKALRAIGHASLETTLQDHPETYIRLLNSLSRLTTGAMTCQANRRKEEQREEAAQLNQADPDSLCITAETLAKIEKLLRLR